MSILSGWIPDNIVPPATAAAKAGVPVADVAQALELPEGLLIVTLPSHAIVDPAGDALPSMIIRGV